ncbi:MAG: hypothetical protein ACYC3I_10955 [Gemmataceae bacterium]
MNMQLNKLSASHRFFARLCFLCVLCDSVVSSSSRAAAPRDELLRLVPDSVGFCLVVQDLRGHAAALLTSPFLEKLSQSPVAVKIRNSPDLKKLDRLESHMKEKLGLDWTRLRDDILGDALVMAYRPGPPGKPELEEGVFLLRARNEKVLAEIVERINKVQKEEGELKDLDELRHNGSVYYRRVEIDKHTERDKTTYYYVHGPILALSTRESMLRQVIDCDRTASSDAVPESAQRLRELDAERALLAVWINPRAFDAELNAKIADTPAKHCETVKHFALYWKALDSVVLSLSLAERDVSLSLGVQARVKEMPPAVRRLFRDGATASDLWRRFPESALFAAGGRFDGATVLEVFGGFLTAEDRQALHSLLNRQFGALLGEEDFARDVLPALGPDWGLCLTAPATRDKNWMPQLFFALRIDAGRTKKRLERKLLDALDFAARLVVFGYNSQHADAPITLKSAEVDGQEVRYLACPPLHPPQNGGGDLQPAYGLLHGYLIVSSSLDGLTRFARTKPAAASAAGAPIPLLRISFKSWREYLNQRRESIVQFLADHHKLRRDEVGQQLDGWLTYLQFVDRLELSQRSAPCQVHFTLSVQTAQALKK